MTRYVRAGVLWREVPGAVMLLAPAGGDVVELQDSAVALWRLLARPVTLSEAATALADVFGASAAEVEVDVAQALAELTRRGVVEKLTF